MSNKTNWKTIVNLVKRRNHKIVSNEKSYKNVKSRLTFYCFDCKNSFVTTWASYKQASKTGCPTCKKNSISRFQKNRPVSTETKHKISKSNLGKPGSLLGKKGPEHPRWKGGTYDRLKGSSNDAYLWRKAIKSKYKNCCALTFSTDNLDCHHLVSWHCDKEKRLSAENGVLLTKQIHKDFHQKYGYRNNTEEQFAEYCFIFFSIDWFEYKKKFDLKQTNE